MESSGVGKQKFLFFSAIALSSNSARTFRNPRSLSASTDS